MLKLVNALLDWYDVEGRDLPWRGTQDPYRILVSEIMLQQTQVSRVRDLYYKQWLIRFPDWQSLAKATNGEVIEAWAGLGYNRRALMLRDIARQVEEQGIPKTREQWLELKGVGPYTSAALAVFSLRQRAVPIDTNIRRVIGRMNLGEPYPQPDQDEKIEQVGKQLMKAERFYDVPQALFDLATNYCLKKPLCASCPMKSECQVSSKFISGTVEPPKRMNPKSNEIIHREKPYPDRIFRGRILKLVREQGRVPFQQLGNAVDKTYDQIADEAWLEKMVERLEKDGMIERTGKTLKFPD